MSSPLFLFSIVLWGIYYLFLGPDRVPGLFEVILDRCEHLMNRVTLLEQEFQREKERSEKFEGLSFIYRKELEETRLEVLQYKTKLDRITKWKNVLNRLV